MRHYGLFNFSTSERLERPYLDDVEKVIVMKIAEYLRGKGFTCPIADVRVKINVSNQEKE